MSNSMDKNEIITRVELMMKYYAYQKENADTSKEAREYETKFFTLKNLWEDIMFNRELAEPYKKVIKEVSNMTEKKKTLKETAEEVVESVADSAIKVKEYLIDDTLKDIKKIATIEKKEEDDE